VWLHKRYDGAHVCYVAAGFGVSVYLELQQLLTSISASDGSRCGACRSDCARSLAMGDSLRAMATQSEGMLLNPSGLALTKQFQVSGFYSLRLPSVGHFLHASMSDSITNSHFALGLYYNYLHETPHFAYRLRNGGDSFAQTVQGAEIIRTGHESGTALAIPIGERVSIGATLKYGYYTLRSQLGQDMAPPGQSAADGRIDAENGVDLGSVGHVVTFDVGATVRPFGGLHIGVVGQNLWPHGYEMPTLLGIGLAISSPTG
jgi:hypothetical protein